MSISLPRGVSGSRLVAAAIVLGAATLEAAPQQADGRPPVSLDRIKEGLEQAPALRLEIGVPLQTPPTFTSRVDQHVFVPTLEQELHKQFDLNELQRQSADWAAKCCGLDIGSMLRAVDRARRERQIRKTRAQIARELAELKAARSRKP